MARGSPEGRKTHLLLRCYKLSQDGSAGGEEAELAGHQWPLESVCQVNGTFQQLKQRKVWMGLLGLFLTGLVGWLIGLSG